MTEPMDRIDLYRSFDARVWAREFIKTVKLHPDMEVDEDAMIGWFSNALMRGYDERAKDIERFHDFLEAADLRSAFELFATEWSRGN